MQKDQSRLFPAFARPPLKIMELAVSAFGIAAADIRAASPAHRHLRAETMNHELKTPFDSSENPWPPRTARRAEF
jgi:hypothetical protein